MENEDAMHEYSSIGSLPSVSDQNLCLSRIKRTPNSPLIKSPFIKIKIETKNLEKAFSLGQDIIVLNELKENYSLTKYSIQLTPYGVISLNNQKKVTKPIFHNSPKWLEEYEFEVSNTKVDKILCELYTNSIVTNISTKNFKNTLLFDKFSTQQNEEPVFIGFQLLPIVYLEKTMKVGSLSTIWMRLINKKPDEYFVSDPKHVLHIDNHNPENYKVDENLIKGDKDLGVSLIKFSFEYMNFYYLWMLNCSVHSIIQKEDKLNPGKCFYIYRLFIKRNDDMEWYKECTFEELEDFRNYVVNYDDEVKNIPFPCTSLLSYIPIIGKYYDDSNNDVLVEKKYVLDLFFGEICSNMQIYKLDLFNKFFSETI